MADAPRFARVDDLAVVKCFRSIDQNDARRLATRAIRHGQLSRQPCAVCGDPKSHGHHDDYRRPLDLQWLCHPHHKVADRARVAAMCRKILSPEQLFFAHSRFDGTDAQFAAKIGMYKPVLWSMLSGEHPTKIKTVIRIRRWLEQAGLRIDGDGRCTVIELPLDRWNRRWRLAA